VFGVENDAQTVRPCKLFETEQHRPAREAGDYCGTAPPGGSDLAQPELRDITFRNRSHCHSATGELCTEGAGLSMALIDEHRIERQRHMNVRARRAGKNGRYRQGRNGSALKEFPSVDHASP
jgi:hypothetical protein